MKFASTLRTLRGHTSRPALCPDSGLGGVPPFGELPPLPQRSSLRSGFFCPSPSTLKTTSSVPLGGTSRFRRLAAYTVCLRCAGAPRRPPSGSELSLMLFHNMSPSETTGNSPAALAQYFTADAGLQPGIRKFRHSRRTSHSDSGEVCVFEA